MRKRSPAPVEMAIPEQPEQQKRFRTPRKKTKKDYEKSRREREGGSLMARSLKQHKKTSAGKEAGSLPDRSQSSYDSYCQGICGSAEA